MIGTILEVLFILAALYFGFMALMFLLAVVFGNSSERAEIRDRARRDRALEKAARAAGLPPYGPSIATPIILGLGAAAIGYALWLAL